MEDLEKILLIDDEPNVLNAFKRRLGSKYEVFASTSGSDALKIIKEHPEIAAVVSDMQMPGMNGTEILKEIAKKNPDCIRIMLTGMPDQKTAAQAINDGAVFRFLTKPCSLDDLEVALQYAIDHRRLLRHEKELLKNTLGGIIKLVSELISGIDPLGAEKADQTRRIIKEICKAKEVQSLELELAPLFGNLGKLSLPLELLYKLTSNEELSIVEKKTANLSYSTSARLIRGIPRLDKIATIIECAHGDMEPPENLKQLVQIYKLANKLLDIAQPGSSETLSLKELTLRSLGQLNNQEQELIKFSLSQEDVVKPVVDESVSGYLVSFSELCPGQMLMTDILDKSGKLLLKRGFMLSRATIERIKTYEMLVGVQTPIKVSERIPTKN